MIRAVEQLPEGAWMAVPADDDRPVVVIAHHIASMHEAVAGLVAATAAGRETPALTWNALDQLNAQHAA